MAGELPAPHTPEGLLKAQAGLVAEALGEDGSLAAAQAAAVQATPPRRRRGPKQPRLVAVLRAHEAADAVWGGRILAKAGFVVEVAFTTPQAALAIAELAAEGLCVGAGTVLDARMAEDAVGAGADFLVAPGHAPEAARVAAEAGRLFLPGAFTPTEVMARRAEGFAHLKLFPAASAGGPKHLKLLADPFPGLSLVPTGGVQLEEVGAYAEAGASALAIGSSLAPPLLLAERGSEALWARVDRWLQAAYEATWRGEAPPWLSS